VRRNCIGDAEQAMKSNLLNNIQTFVQIRPMMIYENQVQGLGSLESLLIWDHEEAKVTLGKVIRHLVALHKEPSYFSS